MCYPYHIAKYQQWTEISQVVIQGKSLTVTLQCIKLCYISGGPWKVFKTYSGDW
jgi:hypothetical protein